MQKLIVVAVSGLAFSGKTEFTDRLESANMRDNGTKRVHNLLLRRMSLARPLKEMALELGWDKQKDERGRALLRGIGSVGRAYDEDCWARMLMQRARANIIRSQSIGFNTTLISVDDVRFPSELRYLAHLDKHMEIQDWKADAFLFYFVQISSSDEVREARATALGAQIVKEGEHESEQPKRLNEEFSRIEHGVFIPVRNEGSFENLHCSAEGLLDDAGKKLNQEESHD